MAAFLLSVQMLLTCASAKAAGFCQEIAQHGFLFDSSQAQSSQNSFSQIKQNYSHDFTSTYDEVKNMQFDSGGSWLGIIDGSLGGSTNSQNYIERRDKVCKSDYSTFSGNSGFNQNVAVVSARMQDVLLQCAQNEDGFFAYVTPSSDLRSYTITIKNNVQGDNRVNITYLPEPQQCHVSLPKQVNSGDTLLCSKQANQTTIVVMNTDKGGIAHVEVPGTDALVTGMLTDYEACARL